MTDDIAQMKADVSALRQECTELRSLVDALLTTGDGEQRAFQEPPAPADALVPGQCPPRRPFDIWYDFRNEGWRIYLPNACVMVGTAVATCRKSATDGIVQLSSLPANLYCHVYAEEDGKYTYDIDSEGEDEDAMLTFPVAKCSRDTEVEAQFVSGLVLLERAKKKAYVVTRVSETMTESEGIVLHVSRAPILVDVPSGSEASASLSESPSSTTVATFTSVTYVTGSVYDPSGHTFKNKRRTVKAIISTDNASSDSASVFTAKPVCGGN